jgi:hypothetical protein
MHTNCPALYLIDLPSWIFCTVGILKVLLEGDVRYYPHIFFYHIKTYGGNSNISIPTTGLEVDVLVSCAATGDSCHTFIIFLFAPVKTFKHEYATKRIHIAGNISLRISATFFPSLIGLHVISSYDLLTLYGTPSSDFHILSTSPVIWKTETCAKSRTCA